MCAEICGKKTDLPDTYEYTLSYHEKQISNDDTHTHTKILFLSVSLHQLQPQNLQESKAIENTCPKYHKVGVNLKLNGWKAECLITQKKKISHKNHSYTIKRYKNCKITKSSLTDLEIYNGDV